MHLLRRAAFRALQIPGGALMLGGGGFFLLSCEYAHAIASIFNESPLSRHFLIARGIALAGAVVGSVLVNLAEKIEPEPTPSHLLLNLD